MRILLVEDSYSISLTLRFALEIEGHEVLSVERGEQGLPLLQKHSFDLILLDLQTGGISAQKFTEALKKIKTVKDDDSPIVCLFSASASIEDEARRLGIHHVIRKPFDCEQLIFYLNSIQRRGTSWQINSLQSVESLAQLAC